VTIRLVQSRDTVLRSSYSLSPLSEQ